MSGHTESKVNPWPYIVIFGVVLYLIIDIILAYLRPDYSLLHNAESDYGRGPYFWIMDINFLLRCAFSLALVKAIWTALPKDIFIRKSSYWLVSWAISSGLLAFFADNPYGYSKLWSSPIHSLLAFIAFISAIIGMIALGWQFRNIQNWGKLASALSGISILAVISLLLIGHAHFRPASLGGLYERIFLGLVLAWEVIVAGKIISITKRN